MVNKRSRLFTSAGGLLFFYRAFPRPTSKLINPFVGKCHWGEFNKPPSWTDRRSKEPHLGQPLQDLSPTATKGGWGWRSRGASLLPGLRGRLQDSGGRVPVRVLDMCSRCLSRSHSCLSGGPNGSFPNHKFKKEGCLHVHQGACDSDFKASDGPRPLACMFEETEAKVYVPASLTSKNALFYLDRF